MQGILTVSSLALTGILSYMSTPQWCSALNTVEWHGMPYILSTLPAAESCCNSLQTVCMQEVGCQQRWFNSVTVHFCTGNE